MFLTYRFKLQPKLQQHRILEGICDLQRQLYNAALQERVDAWQKQKISISKLDQNKSLTQIRSFDESFSSLPVSMSRWSIARVDEAMKGFFGRVKRGQKAGFPRFKARSRWRSFGFDEFKGIRLLGNKLVFASFKSGLKVRMHRPIPEGTEIKSCVFTRHSRHWWVSMSVDVPVEAVHLHPDAEVGLDLGVSRLVTTSDGEFIENARPRSKRERDLRIAQRALARCKRGSMRRRKLRERMARLQRAVYDARTTHLHQVSSGLTKRYGFIGLEKLQTKNMTRSARGSAAEPGTNVRQKAGLNREMLDASFARLVDFITYKAERAGGTVVKVDPRGTSQECSSCGSAVPKTLAERIHRCACGTVLDRDVNAALNILHRALQAHGRARPPGGVNVGHRPVRRPGIAPGLAA